MNLFGNYQDGAFPRFSLLRKKELFQAVPFPGGIKSWWVKIFFFPWYVSMNALKGANIFAELQGPAAEKFKAG